MADNYISFNYNNSNFTTTLISPFNNKLSDFGGFIINEGNDLTFFNPSEFSHEFVTPQFGKQSYFLGTTRENREFNFPILLKGITLDIYREFLRWLNPEEEGILSFDYSPNYGYDVKVNNISEATFYVTPNCDTSNPTYDIELEIGFITKNDWAARWIGPAAIKDFVFPSRDQLIDNEDGYNFISSTRRYDINGFIFTTVNLATTTNIHTLSGVVTVDGESAFGGYRILVKNQTNPSENGIYIVNPIGGWTRASDFDSNSEIVNNIVKVAGGAENMGTSWSNNWKLSYTLGSDYMYFSQCWYLINNHNLPNYYKISYAMAPAPGAEDIWFTISFNNIDYYTWGMLHPNTYTGTIYTKYGFILDENNNFKYNEISNYQSCIIKTDPKSNIIFSYPENSTLLNLDTFTIEPISREII